MQSFNSYISFLFLFMLLSLNINAQDKPQADNIVKYEGQVEKFINDALILNQKTELQKGWHIQLLSTVDRSDMEYQLNRFENQFPSLEADWTHERPYYKINVGAFLKREDAIRVLYLVQEEFPSAICKKSSSLKKKSFLY